MSLITLGDEGLPVGEIDDAQIRCKFFDCRLSDKAKELSRPQKRNEFFSHKAGMSLSPADKGVTSTRRNRVNDRRNRGQPTFALSQECALRRSHSPQQSPP